MDPVMNLDDAARTLEDAASALTYSGIPFFLTYGTALGAIREGDFLAHDGDIDLGAFSEDFVPRASVLAAALIDEGFEVRNLIVPFTRCWAIKCSKRGINVDIVAWTQQRSFRFNPNTDLDFVHALHSKLLENLSLVSLRGGSYSCPGEAYLAETYGDWRTPKPTDWEHDCRIDSFSYSKNLLEVYDPPIPKTTCAPLFELALERHGKDASVSFYAGVIVGEAEKVWLGACRAAVLRPQGETVDLAYCVIWLSQLIGSIYDLEVLVIKDEVWMFHPSAKRTVKELEGIEKNSPLWHRVRAGLLGVPAGRVDLKFHERKCTS
jgi:LicD family